MRGCCCFTLSLICVVACRGGVGTWLAGTRVPVGNRPVASFKKKVINQTGAIIFGLHDFRAVSEAIFLDFPKMIESGSSRQFWFRQSTVQVCLYVQLSLASLSLGSISLVPCRLSLLASLGSMLYW